MDDLEAIIAGECLQNVLAKVERMVGQGDRPRKPQKDKVSKTTNGVQIEDGEIPASPGESSWLNQVFAWIL